MKKYLRNINRLFALFLLLGNISVIASECPSVELNGNVIEIVLKEEDKANIVYDLIIELEFVNKSDTPILLSKREPWLNSTFIASSQEKLSTREYMYSATLFPANDISAKWEKLRQELDKPTPPEEYFKVVLPGDNWRFEVETVIAITKQSGNGGNRWNISDWSDIKTSSELWLQLEVNLWHPNIEPVQHREDQGFGKKLRVQWEKYGYLWLVDTTTRPILLDLKSATKNCRKNC